MNGAPLTRHACTAYFQRQFVRHTKSFLFLFFQPFDFFRFLFVVLFQTGSFQRRVALQPFVLVFQCIVRPGFSQHPHLLKRNVSIVPKNIFVVRFLFHCFDQLGRHQFAGLGQSFNFFLFERHGGVAGFVQATGLVVQQPFDFVVVSNQPQRYIARADVAGFKHQFMGFAIDGRFRLVGDEKRQTCFEINAGDVVGQVGGRQRWFGVGQFRRGKRGGDLGLGMGRWGRQSSDLVGRIDSLGSLGSMGRGGIFGGGGSGGGSRGGPRRRLLPRPFQSISLVPYDDLFFQQNDILQISFAKTVDDLIAVLDLSFEFVHQFGGLVFH